MYLDGWNRIFGTRHVALRFANVYGPRQSAALEGGVVAIFLERLAAGEPTTIFGDGTITRDFVHVDDVVRALLLAAEHDGGVFNVGTGVETTIADLHALCERAVGVDAPPRTARRGGRRPRSVLDTTKASAELGFTAIVPLAEGIAATARRRDPRAAGGVDEAPRGLDADREPRRRRARRPAGRRARLTAGRSRAGAGESVRVVDHPLRLDHAELAVRPWRTATLVVAGIAALELVLLVDARRRAPREAGARGRRQGGGAQGRRCETGGKAGGEAARPRRP